MDLSLSKLKRGVLILLCTVIFYSIVIEIRQEYYVYTSGSASVFDLSLNILTLFLLTVVLERFLPFKAISPDDWEYRVRPSSFFHLNSRSILGQLVACAAIGLVIGASNGHIILYPFLAILLRAGPLLVRNKDIPKLLASGKTKLITHVSGWILDSELINSAIVDSQMRWIAFHPTSNYFKLVFRRLVRQSHLIVLGSFIILLSWSLMGTLPAYSLIFFMLSWSVLGGLVARCGDFSKLGGSRRPKYVVLILHSAIASVFIISVAPLSKVLLAFALTGPSVFIAGLLRSGNRNVEQLTFIETGIVGAISPELIGYYCEGIFAPFLASLILVFHAF